MKTFLTLFVLFFSSSVVAESVADRLDKIEERLDKIEKFLKLNQPVSSDDSRKFDLFLNFYTSGQVKSDLSSDKKKCVYEIYINSSEEVISNIDNVAYIFQIYKEKNLDENELEKLFIEKLKMNSKDAEEYIETIFDIFDEC